MRLLEISAEREGDTSQLVLTRVTVVNWINEYKALSVEICDSARHASTARSALVSHVFETAKAGHERSSALSDGG